MTETVVKLNSPEDIVEFVRLTSMCPDEVIICTPTHILNGKTILDIYTLDLSNPFKVEFHGDIPQAVREGMSKFIAN